MRFSMSSNLSNLGSYIPRFLDLVGKERWFRRVDQLDADQRRSPYNWKIVCDYHWLEMGVSFQSDVLGREGHLRPELIDGLMLSALSFAATTVEVYGRLTETGRRNLQGRLRDCLKAETGYASLYFELELAQRLMNAGFNIGFEDMEGSEQYDLSIARKGFTAEVECKSLSADAGRQIHRKDFYRFMESLSPIFDAHLKVCRPELVEITVNGRLSPNVTDRAALRAAVQRLIEDRTQVAVFGKGFEVKRRDFNSTEFGGAEYGTKEFYKACTAMFGENVHVAGGLSEDRGCLVAMRSVREDDTSKPMLEAMRKASDQVSGRFPAFIGIQLHGIEAADLMLPHVRRQAAILSHALYRRYGVLMTV